MRVFLPQRMANLHAYSQKSKQTQIPSIIKKGTLQYEKRYKSGSLMLKRNKY